MKKRIISLVLAIALLLPAMSFAMDLTDSQKEEAQNVVTTFLSGRDRR